MKKKAVTKVPTTTTKLKIEVNRQKILKEFYELISLAIKEHGSFMMKFSELYWKVYIPLKTGESEH